MGFINVIIRRTDLMLHKAIDIYAGVNDNEENLKLLISASLALFLN